MKAVVRYWEASKGCKFLDDAPIPIPPAEHVQIKVMASPVNPADEAFCAGLYTPHGKTEPFCCGYEGSGIVTLLGEGVPKEFLNKRVAFYRALDYTDPSFGVWSQYAVLHYSTCIILDDSMSFEETCGILINPLTLLGFFEIIQKDKHKSVVHTAAASALGKSLLKYCQLEKVELVCIVRKEEQKKTLEALGAKYILDQNDPNFEKYLKKVTTEIGCTIAFDAVGGDLTGKLFSGMPPKSTIYMYGDLGGSYKGLAPSHFMYSDSTLKGFVLSHAELYTNPAKKAEAMNLIISDIRKGNTTFKTKVIKRYKLEEYANALKEYKSYANEGKGIICPNP